jgi:hypothetical protein
MYVRILVPVQIPHWPIVVIAWIFLGLGELPVSNFGPETLTALTVLSLFSSDASGKCHDSESN